MRQSSTQQAMKKNLFSAGDIIRHKRTGDIQTVVSVPGDLGYNSSLFIDPEEGMITDSGWQYQAEWELISSNTMAMPKKNSDPTLHALQAALYALKSQVATPKKMGNYYGGISMGGYGGASGAGGVGMASPRFQRGQRIVLMGGSDGDIGGPECNPFWGRNGEYIAGIIESASHSPSRIGIEYIVRWDNGKANRYFDDVSDLQDWKNAPAPKAKIFSSGVSLDTTKLDALVLDPKVKTDILALLYQHKHAKKLFEDWGLGDVIEYGRGMTMMFYGPPGTGKTYGANCIAKALGKELLVLGAAEIQTSEPGGANRNIQNAFSDARTSNKVLFIDECDSLISNRNNLGMILASEINTLLTEIEKFEGVCILASNRIGDMDPALERRLSLIIEFPMPNMEQRMEIWKKLLPVKMPLHEDVKVEKLAEMELSGGLIKNVVLQGARLAISESAEKVEMGHFERALDRVRSSKGLMGKDKIQTDGMSTGSSSSKTVEKNLVDFFKDRK